jgi:hypothetical protein
MPLGTALWYITVITIVWFALGLSWQLYTILFLASILVNRWENRKIETNVQNIKEFLKKEGVKVE